MCRLLWICFLAAPPALASPSLFFATAPRSLVQGIELPAALRRRSLELNPAWLAAVGPRGKNLKRGQPLRFNPFSDLDLDLLVDRVSPSPGGGFVIEAAVPGSPDGVVLLAFQGSVMSGLALAGGPKAVLIRYAGGNSHQALELDSGSLRSCPENPPVAPDGGDGGAGFQGPWTFWPAEPSPGCDPGPALTLIDLLGVYTANAVTVIGGESALRAQVEVEMAFMNRAFRNSNVATEIRLVQLSPIAYSDSGSVSLDLARLSATADGVMDGVHALRDLYGADLVTLFTGAGDFGGIGYVMQNPGPSFASSGFNVVKITNPFTIAHEVGHNLGCAHDRANASVPGAFDYSYGYSFSIDGNTYGTVMSYVGSILAHYSSPDISFLGETTGLPEFDPASADNARTLNQTRAVASAFRPQAVTVGFPAVTIIGPAAGAAYSALDAVTIQATASDPDGTVQFVDFYLDHSLVGEVSSAPFDLVWSPLPSGSHYLQTVATDDAGGRTASCPVSIEVLPTLPAPWEEISFGPYTLMDSPGSAGYSGGSYTLNSSGPPGFGLSETLHYVHQEVCGDGMITARIVSVENTSSTAIAGLMIRETLASNSRQLFIGLSPANGFTRWVRTSAGSAGAGVQEGSPRATGWVRIQRTGSSFVPLISTDGVSWIPFNGETWNLSLPQNLRAGLAGGSGLSSDLSTAVFDNVTLSFAGPCASPTPTKTVTLTRTLTWTFTSTDSPTPTITPTSTASPTWTATSTQTRTWTLTATATWTPTNTATSTATPSWTPTASPSRTPTSTWSPTATFSWTPTFTWTWTPTSTPSWTRTATGTLTPTSSPSSTFTPSDSATHSATRTATGTPSWTLTASPTRSPTASVTATPTASVTATASASRSSTGTLTATMTSTPTATDSPSRTPSPSPTLTKTASATRTVSATASQSPTLTPTPAQVSPAEIHPYPNPVRVVTGSETIRFAGVSPGQEVRIYTAAGRHVVSLKESRSWDPVWDLRNSQGRQVASGSYCWLVLDGNTKAKLGLLAVIR